MIAQRTPTSKFIEPVSQAAVHEAMRFLATSTMTRRWVCETCGAIHTVVAPAACDSCGAINSLVPQPEMHREINSRW